MAITEEETMEDTEDMEDEAIVLIAVEDTEDMAEEAMAEEDMVEEAMEAEDTTEDIGPGLHTTTITDTMDVDHGDLPTAITNFLFMKEVTSVPTSR